MPAAHPSRKYGIAGVSLAAHAALIGVLALQTPRLAVPPMESGPPEAVIPVLIMPRTPPPSAAPHAEPTPVRLHRRPQRFAAEPLPVKPLVTPAAPDARRPSPSTGPRTLAVPPEEDALAANARGALRAKLGCDDPHLTRAEREACQERLGSGARDASFPGLGLDRDKSRALDRATARREADYRYKRSLPGPKTPVPYGAGWDNTRSPPPGDKNKGMGASSEDYGATPTRVPF